MNGLIDMRQHLAETQGPGSMRITLLAIRWAQARDNRLAAFKEKKVSDAWILRARAKCEIPTTDTMARAFAADKALAVARREESRAKRLLLAECKALMARRQADVIDV